MEIRRLDLEQYRGKKLRFEYQTPGYWELIAEKRAFRFEYRAFPQPKEHMFEDVLLQEWLEKPVLFGAFEGGELAGLIEGSIESWNNRFRISNLLVDWKYRKRGIGAALMARMLEEAAAQRARMAVLEVQSCNVPAMHLYERCGFQIIGFDMFSYSNEDLENHEMRIEMGKKL